MRFQLYRQPLKGVSITFFGRDYRSLCCVTASEFIESESSERKSGRQNDLNLFGCVNKIPKQVLVRIRTYRVGRGIKALVDHIR
jgi:hypothetical protein